MARGPIDSCGWQQGGLQKGCSVRVTGAYFLLVEGRTRGQLLRRRSHYQHQCERCICSCCCLSSSRGGRRSGRSEEHTSELQSPCNLVCRLLLEKKKKIKNQ